MKKSILLAAAFVAFIATSCRKIEMDGGTNVIQQPTTPGVQTMHLLLRVVLKLLQMVRKKSQLYSHQTLQHRVLVTGVVSLYLVKLASIVHLLVQVVAQVHFK
jgi:hypothetical protein